MNKQHLRIKNVVNVIYWPIVHLVFSNPPDIPAMHIDYGSGNYIWHFRSTKGRK